MYDMVRDYVTILLDAEEEQTRSADKEQARRLLAEARATRPPLASDADVALERTHQLRQRRQLELEKLPARVIAVLDAQDELHRKTHLALRDTSTKNWDARSTAFKLFLAKTAEAAPRQLSQQEYDAEYSRQQTIRERNPAQPLPMPGACPLQTEPVMEFRNAAGGRMACIVALDCSGSMTGQGAQHAQRVLFAIHDITRRLGIPSEDVLCVPFGWASGQHKRFCSKQQLQPQPLAEFLTSTSVPAAVSAFGGGTDPYAVQATMRVMSDRMLVTTIVTDGELNCPDPVGTYSGIARESLLTASVIVGGGRTAGTRALLSQMARSSIGSDTLVVLRVAEMYASANEQAVRQMLECHFSSSVAADLTRARIYRNEETVSPSYTECYELATNALGVDKTPLPDWALTHLRTRHAGVPYRGNSLVGRHVVFHQRFQTKDSKTLLGSALSDEDGHQQVLATLLGLFNIAVTVNRDATLALAEELRVQHNGEPADALTRVHLRYSDEQLKRYADRFIDMQQGVMGVIASEIADQRFADACDLCRSTYLFDRPGAVTRADKAAAAVQTVTVSSSAPSFLLPHLSEPLANVNALASWAPQLGQSGWFAVQADCITDAIVRATHGTFRREGEHGLVNPLSVVFACTVRALLSDKQPASKLRAFTETALTAFIDANTARFEELCMERRVDGVRVAMLMTPPMVRFCRARMSFTAHGPLWQLDQLLAQAAEFRQTVAYPGGLALTRPAPAATAAATVVMRAPAGRFLTLEQLHAIDSRAVKVLLANFNNPRDLEPAWCNTAVFFVCGRLCVVIGWVERTPIPMRNFPAGACIDGMPAAQALHAAVTDGTVGLLPTTLDDGTALDAYPVLVTDERLTSLVRCAYMTNTLQHLPSKVGTTTGRTMPVEDVFAGVPGFMGDAFRMTGVTGLRITEVLRVLPLDVKPATTLDKQHANIYAAFGSSPDTTLAFARAIARCADLHNKMVRSVNKQTPEHWGTAVAAAWSAEVAAITPGAEPAAAAYVETDTVPYEQVVSFVSDPLLRFLLATPDMNQAVHGLRYDGDACVFRAPRTTTLAMDHVVVNLGACELSVQQTTAAAAATAMRARLMKHLNTSVAKMLQL
jgi:hypothetical protein